MQGGAHLEAFIATTDVGRSRAFYEGVLGLSVVSVDGFALVVDGGGTHVRIAQVETAPALPFTVLGWVVTDITAAVEQLRTAGVHFTRYDGMDQDDHDVWTAPGGDRVAWFTDPDSNVLSLHQPG